MKTREQLEQEAQQAELAMEDAKRALLHGVDRNPFSTSSARGLWKKGFDGLPLPEINAEHSHNWRVWERGRQARLIVDNMTLGDA